MTTLMGGVGCVLFLVGLLFAVMSVVGENLPVLLGSVVTALVGHWLADRAGVFR